MDFAMEFTTDLKGYALPLYKIPDTFGYFPYFQGSKYTQQKVPTRETNSSPLCSPLCPLVGTVVNTRALNGLSFRNLYI